MPQDAFTMRIAAKELDAMLSGGRVNKLNQPTADEITMQIYSGGKNYNLIASANAQCARVCTTSLEKQNPDVAPNFCMLLRKHLSGATVAKVENLGYERITRIMFNGRNDFFEPVEKALVCEIMGKYSNIILTENGKILGTLRPFSGDLAGTRILLTGMEYTLPPAQDKVEITDKTRVLGHFLDYSGENLPVFIASIIKGIARQTAQEAVTRFYGTNTPSGFEGKQLEFYDFLFEFLQAPIIKPNICPSNNPTDFYAVEYTHICGERKYFDRLTQAEEYFYDKLETEKALNRKRKEITDKLKAHEKKLNKKLQLLREKALDCEGAELHRIKGDLITAYQYSIPVASSGVELDNFYDENGGKLKIALNPDFSANQNAQNYYKKYAKLKKTLTAITPQIEETEAELEYLDAIYTEVNDCERPNDFDFISEELRAYGLIKTVKATKKKKEKDSSPRAFVKDGFTIRVGRNNLQNDRLTFSSGRDDIWLHTKGFHSAHVIIELEGKPLADEVLLFAAELCAYHSKARGGDKVPVDYCKKRYVKKPPKAKPGGVIYTDFKTLLVTPAAHLEAEKK